MLALLLTAFWALPCSADPWRVSSDVQIWDKETDQGPRRGVLTKVDQVLLGILGYDPYNYSEPVKVVGRPSAIPRYTYDARFRQSVDAQALYRALLPDSVVFFAATGQWRRACAFYGHCPQLPNAYGWLVAKELQHNGQADDALDVLDQLAANSLGPEEEVAVEVSMIHVQLWQGDIVGAVHRWDTLVSQVGDLNFILPKLGTSAEHVEKTVLIKAAASEHLHFRSTDDAAHARIALGYYRRLNDRFPIPEGHPVYVAFADLQNSYRDHP